jgi:hypothetical protein
VGEREREREAEEAIGEGEVAIEDAGMARDGIGFFRFLERGFGPELCECQFTLNLAVKSISQK